METHSPDASPDLWVGAAARSFVIMATGASLAAFDVGLDLGAFDNIDHRKVWAIWVLSTVALVSSYLFRNGDFRLGGRWRAALGIPTLWLIADLVWDTSANQAIVVALLAASLLALPFAVYVLARLVAGEFFGLTPRLRIALAITVLAAFFIGWVVGSQHERLLTCRDFERAGEYVPDNCNTT